MSVNLQPHYSSGEGSPKYSFPNVRIQTRYCIRSYFLLPIEQWSKIAINPLKHKKKYILCFKILSVNPIYYQLINKLHKETGYEIVHIDTSYRYKPIKGHLYSTAGPLEFIGLIKDAEIVVTNSFHGTVFQFCSINHFIQY